MGALADLALSVSGSPLETAAAALRVTPQLFQRIDQGMQPMPAKLGQRLATLLGVELWQIQDAVQLWTDLDDGLLYHAIPPRPGEIIQPARVRATAPVTLAGGSPAPPSTTSRVVFFLNDGVTLNGSATLEEYLVGSDGSMSKIGGAPDNGDYTTATSGIFVPATSPTIIATLDHGDIRVNAINPTTFAALSNYGDSTPLVSPQLLAFDGTYVWYASVQDQSLHKLDPADFTTSLASCVLGQDPRALIFSGGFLYVLTHAPNDDTPANTDWSLTKVNPATATIVKTSNTYTSLLDGMQPNSIALTPSLPGTFITTGDTGKIIQWVEGVSVINPTSISLTGTSVSGLLRSMVYDAANDLFWSTGTTSLARMTVNGFVSFAATVNPATPAATLPCVVDALGVVLVPATSGANNVVQAYSLQPASLLSQTAVGTGPNPTGQNNPPLSFAVRPTS